VIDQRFYKRRLVKIEEFISSSFRGGARRRGRWLLRISRLCRRHRARAAGRCGATYDGAFEKIAAIELLFCHGSPPCL
jgi:hypothetical protein